jgi:hypothetical protein
MLRGPVIEGSEVWDGRKLETQFELYFADHQLILTDRQARHPQYCRIHFSQESDAWDVEQILVDPDEHNDWKLIFRIDRPLSRDQGKPVLSLLGIEEIGG